jgi:hypothetical protein
MPDLDAQRTAMKKLGFLVGKWIGEARLLRGPGEPVILVQTEEARFKLDGLILEIEGIGQTKPDNKPILQALGIISFDDETGTYHMRAFNDGRFLETGVKLLEDGKSLTWGFALVPSEPVPCCGSTSKASGPNLPRSPSTRNQLENFWN